MKQFFYHLKSAIENLKLNQTMALFSLISLSLTMMLFGLFLLFYYNVQDFVQSMRESVQFSIYLREQSDQKAIERIEENLKTDPRILSFRYISKEEALQTFKTTFQDNALIERLGSNPFPASFEVKVKTTHQDPSLLKGVVDRFKTFSGVEEVQYGSEWLKNLVVFLRLLKIIGMGIGGFLAVSVMTNIANTIRLHFYNRREEIEIMKLIGATHRFIKIPFVLEGLLMGAISGGLSTLFLLFVFVYSKNHFVSILGTIGRTQGLQFLPMNILMGLILAGSTLGGIGSFISLNHLLRLRNPGHEKRTDKKEKNVVLLLLSLMLIAWPGLSPADTPPELSHQIQKEKKDLRKLEAEIKAKRRKSIAAKKEERSILSDLEVIDRRFRLYRKEVILLESNIEDNEGNAQDLTTKIKKMSQEIEKTRRIIAKSLRTIYKEKRSGTLKLLFTSQDYPDMLRKLHYLNTVAKKEGEILSTFKERHTRLEEKKDQLDRVKKRLIEDRTTLTKKLGQSRTEKKQKDRLLSRVRKEGDLFKKAISEMTGSSRQIQALLKRLEEEKKRIKHPSTGKFSKERGQLRWPSDGRVVGLYGRQKHPKFDTMIYRKGIEIVPEKGGMVRNIFDGTIVYADWFRGYGMVIIIDHGENYYSLYAHLDKLLVGVGDRVKKNRVIGEIGETGLSHGAKLYFEIRHQGKPTNPLVWLQKRR